MRTAKLTRQLFWAIEVVLLAGTAVAALWVARPEEWEPVALVALCLMLALLGQWLSVKTSAGELSASLVAIVLAMSLLGPLPAAACGIAAMILTSAMRRLPPSQWLTNLSAFATVPFAGGVLVRAFAGDVHRLPSPTLTQGFVFGLIILGVFILAVALNFIVIALETYLGDGYAFRRQVRDLFLPLLPGQLAAGMLAAILAVAYRSVGMPMLLGSMAVLLILQHLTVALLRSEERADQLEARTRHLVSLQMGVLRTLVRALGMRDPTTSRHASAVARYCEALAKELGCSADSQEVVRTAGLLHDIGKFTWPDRVLHAEVVKDEDQEIVRRHPQDGAELVGALDGYGPAADAILYHHERVDGGGYPAGLIGKEIPLESRILAICCTYHTMTARASYRPPMTSEEAMTELRRAAANGQLDGELVERFLALLEREGSTLAQDADFESMLEFERRVQEMAQPKPASSSGARRVPEPGRTTTAHHS